MFSCFFLVFVNLVVLRKAICAVATAVCAPALVAGQRNATGAPRHKFRLIIVCLEPGGRRLTLDSVVLGFVSLSAHASAGVLMAPGTRRCDLDTVVADAVIHRLAAVPTRTRTVLVVHAAV
jgi:hypothetical protein